MFQMPSLCKPCRTLQIEVCWVKAIAVGLMKASLHSSVVQLPLAYGAEHRSSAGILAA